MSKSLEDRLAEEEQGLQKQADKLKPGPERDELLRRIRRSALPAISTIGLPHRSSVEVTAAICRQPGC
jgi:hypothetical protein